MYDRPSLVMATQLYTAGGSFVDEKVTHLPRSITCNTEENPQCQR